MYYLKDRNGNPWRIENKVIRELRQREEAGDFEAGKFFQAFKSGQWVMISAGVFEGIIGKVIRTRGDECEIEVKGKRVRVLLDGVMEA